MNCFIGVAFKLYAAERERQQIRVGQTLSLAVLAFAVAFAVAAIAGLGRQYFIYSLLNVAALVWVRRKKREEPHDEQAA